MKFLFLLLLSFLFACGSTGNTPDIPKQSKEVIWNVSSDKLSFSSQAESKSILVDVNADWSIASNQSWCTLDRSKGYHGQTNLNVSVGKNINEEQRTAELTLTSGTSSKKIQIIQEAGKAENYVPTGYTLKWQDEFNDARLTGGKPALPNTNKWWYENLKKGAVNNELQTYVSGVVGTDTVAAIADGTLKISAKKVGSEIYSARINSNDSWQYGYFEARLKMPSGKGTWPAFWMMPVDMSLGWPACGEIDIMEYVGYQPNVVHSTVHTKAYNHAIGTQKGKSTSVANAETDFHVYAVEWTADYIKGFVDGVEYFRFGNDKKGDVNTWPFNKPFYVKLNLAWGGDWGGAQGIDENKLPATYEIDYVRVYQK